MAKEKVQKDKQRSTKHTYKTKDRVTLTILKTGCELRCPMYIRPLIVREDSYTVVVPQRNSIQLATTPF